PLFPAGLSFAFSLPLEAPGRMFKPGGLALRWVFKLRRSGFALLGTGLWTPRDWKSLCLGLNDPLAGFRTALRASLFSAPGALTGRQPNSPFPGSNPSGFSGLKLGRGGRFLFGVPRGSAMGNAMAR